MAAITLALACCQGVQDSIRGAWLRRALIVLLLLGCSPLQAASEWLTLQVDEQPRRVWLHAPATMDANTPLLLVFHGRGDDAEPFARAVKLHEDWPEAIVAYPRGEWHEDRPQRGWQYRRGQYADRDLHLTAQLLSQLQQRFGIPRERSFAVGFSNGGHYLLLVQKEQPELFAAYVVIGAVQPAYRSAATARPLLYLFGRGEPRQYQDDWQQTVQALVAHQRSVGPLLPALGCCMAQAAGAGGAPLLFGLYNAGHIWPAQGNDWIRQFLRDPWAWPQPQPQPQQQPQQPSP